jgi:2-C-methyl-D-erythritol 2,4-cyclodiphosphate synthase
MVGIGYDIHRLVEGRRLLLGGVEIDHDQGLAGHSDGDVVLHAVCDALLGAANLGDIGMHFPPDDERYKDISSTVFLKRVRTFLENSGLLTKNIDVVIIAEKPKILPYKEKIKETIANILQIPENSVSIKGKTNEGIGALGEGKAIAALAVCEIAPIYASPQG